MNVNNAAGTWFVLEMWTNEKRAYAIILIRRHSELFANVICDFDDDLILVQWERRRAGNEILHLLTIDIEDFINQLKMSAFVESKIPFSAIWIGFIMPIHTPN